MRFIPDIVPEPDPADGFISRACMARYLLGLMAEDFSQNYYLVSWTEEVPEMLWKAAHGTSFDGAFGERVTLPENEGKLILELATVVDGWWIAAPGHGQESVFMQLAGWRTRMALG